MTFSKALFAVLCLAPGAMVAQTNVPNAPAPPANSSASPTANSATNSTNNPSVPPLQTTVTVNANVTSETPASITVVNQQQLEEIPGTELDDRLRQVPGYSLFRRSSSLVANPTTQGVSLRAIGSTGASRTLVLWDSIPINDPFGGWVYWDRLDPGYIGEVDITRGASNSIFGDRAMAGTITIFSPTRIRVARAPWTSPAPIRICGGAGE